MVDLERIKNLIWMHILQENEENFTEEFRDNVWDTIYSIVKIVKDEV